MSPAPKGAKATTPVVSKANIDYTERAKKRRIQRAEKRRAYFARRAAGGKLTCMQRRAILRAPLREKYLEKCAAQAAAESAEMDRIAGIKAAQETVAGSSPVQGGADAASL